MIYSCIVGSKAHGIAIDTSDTDISVCDGSFERYSTNFSEGKNMLLSPSGRFYHAMLGDDPPWYFTQWLFPQSVLDQTRVSRYIQENKEGIVEARRPVVYRALITKADRLAEHAGWLYDTCPKRMTYSTLLYAILNNYAEGMPFAQAHRPEGELHDFLTGMRLGTVPLEEAAARNERERLRAEKAAAFYRDPLRPGILKEFGQIIREEIEKEASG